eukprot:TRINITY_DN3716_c0_g2_i1.p1 TRINITY_DN3716_c0_g2~~TRINITY_DN3716_c0_g2_i1.p1  ORF type:complete len:462 (+),score=97.89 TRINITY_DN3716_c0_g2_i1:32-1417(+)
MSCPQQPDATLQNLLSTLPQPSSSSSSFAPPTLTLSSPHSTSDVQSTSSDTIITLSASNTSVENTAFYETEIQKLKNDRRVLELILEECNQRLQSETERAERATNARTTFQHEYRLLLEEKNDLQSQLSWQEEQRKRVVNDMQLVEGQLAQKNGEIKSLQARVVELQAQVQTLEQKSQAKLTDSLRKAQVEFENREKLLQIQIHSHRVRANQEQLDRLRLEKSNKELLIELTQTQHQLQQTKTRESMENRKRRDELASIDMEIQKLYEEQRIDELKQKTLCEPESCVFEQPQKQVSSNSNRAARQLQDRQSRSVQRQPKVGLHSRQQRQQQYVPVSSSSRSNQQPSRPKPRSAVDLTLPPLMLSPSLDSKQSGSCDNSLLYGQLHPEQRLRSESSFPFSSASSSRIDVNSSVMQSSTSTPSLHAPILPSLSSSESRSKKNGTNTNAWPAAARLCVARKQRP